jgi:amino acid adenylation domain-containing protein
MSDLMRLFDSLAGVGVVLWGEGSRLRFRASKGALTGEMRSELASNKDLVLAVWRERAAKEIISHPASHGQRALWFLNRSNPESAAYNVVFSARIRSEINLPALHRAFQALVDRHPSLRTSFYEESDYLVQRVHGYMPVCFTVHDRVGVELGVLGKEVHVSSLAPFDLQNGPLMRVDLYSRDSDDHILLLTVHHIAADGWSLFLLLDDLRRLYPSECGTSAAPPSRPTHDVFEFSRWQENMLAGPEGRAHEEYWLSQFTGDLPLLSMPADHPRQASKSVQGASSSIDLGERLSGEVRKLAAKEGTTPFVVLLTAYQVLLHRYTGQQEVIVGSPTYGRDHAEFAEVVGDFINMIPLKSTFHDDPPFRELLGRTRQLVVGGIQHQDYPFPLLVEKLQPVRTFSQTPVFQTVFILQKFKEIAGFERFFRNSDPGVRAEFAGLLLEPFSIPQQEGQFELSLELAESEGVFQGTIKYDANLFAASTIRQLGNHYLTLLEAVVSSPETNVSRLPLITEVDRTSLIDEFNATDREYPRDQTVLDLFRKQVVCRPTQDAIRFAGTALTFEQLDARSTQLARHLQSLGVGPESLVGIYLERGLGMMIGVLAVFKAGAAYLPLDPAFPAERLRYMVEDSGAKVLLTQRALSEPLLSGLNVVSVDLDEAKDQIARQSNEPLPPLAGPSNRAYVLYTSGSTGRPKGVEIEHRSLTNFLCSMAREPALAKDDVLLAVTTLGFDIAGLELFLPVITGARIELASREIAMDGTALARALSNSGAAVMQATPATWRMLFDSGWKGDRGLKVLCGGEAMDPKLAARLASTCGSVWNMYGPTETTIWSLVARIESGEVTIGRPIANTRVYVLDRHREPVPRGVVGELWIGGEGVARGYLSRPELTHERFVADPFRPGERMYRTGDLARHLADGRLVCLGRIDTQVKIRGYRIELDEIATAMSSHPNVRECLVTLQNSDTEDARLVAHVVSAITQPPAVADLRSYLRKSLPDYMVPSSFVFLDAIPLTPNGKLDRSALPGVELSPVDANPGYVPPRDRIEQIVADAWSEVLGVEKIGIFDHFFELGGHSLSAMRLIARLKSAFQIDLPLSSIFIEPTVAGLSKRILYNDLTGRYHYMGETRRWNRLIPAQPRGSRPPLFMVAGYADEDATLRLLSTLIPHLGLNQPVYGLQARWVDGVSQPYSSAKEAALEFISDLRAVQPKGPYMLGGDCVGGIVAVAIAEELLRLGEEVRLLVLLDTHRPNSSLSIGFELVCRWQRVKRVAGILGQLISKHGRERVELFRDLVRRKLGGDQAKTQKERASLRFSHTRTDYARTMYRYRPKKYPGRITLIVNEQQYKSNKSMGWSGVASGGLEVYSTPGEHGTRYLHDREFAERIAECIQRCSPECVSAEINSRGVPEPVANRKIEFGLGHRFIKC